jgi:hypothetical protein
MNNVSNKSCRENQNTNFVFNNFFFRKSSFYEIMWKNIVEEGPQMKIWRPYWITKTTNTHSEYVTFIAATIAASTHLKLTLYVHCRFCAILRCSVYQKRVLCARVMTVSCWCHRHCGTANVCLSITISLCLYISKLLSSVFL